MSEGFADWISPKVEEWTDLWHCLHDAYVLSLEHDSQQRTATLELKLGFPDVEAESGVTSSRATFQFAGASDVQISIADQECFRIASIEEFRHALAEDEAYILQARGSFEAGRSVLEFEGVLNAGWNAIRVLIVGESLAVKVDEKDASVQELLKKGELAWQAFSRK